MGCSSVYPVFFQHNSVAPFVGYVQGTADAHLIAQQSLQSLYVLSHICPRHPWEPAPKLAGSHQAAGCYQLHRNLTSPWFSPSCPHCVNCGWTEVSLSPLNFFAVSGATWQLQANIVSLRPSEKADWNQNVWPCFLIESHHGVLLMWLISTGRYLMNVYILVKLPCSSLSLAVIKLYWFQSDFFMTSHGGYPPSSGGFLQFHL